MRRWLPAAYGFCLTTVVFIAWIGASNTYETLLVAPTLSTSVVDSHLLRACGLFSFSALAGAVVAYSFFRDSDYRTLALVGGMGRTVGLLLAVLVVIDVAGFQHSSVYAGFATTALENPASLAVLSAAGGFLAPFAGPLRTHVRKLSLVAACASWLYLMLYWSVASYGAAMSKDAAPGVVAAGCGVLLVLSAAVWLKPAFVKKPVQS